MNLSENMSLHFATNKACQGCQMAYVDGFEGLVPDKANCLIYSAEYTNGKPWDVEFEGASCPFFLSEEDDAKATVRFEAREKAAAVLLGSAIGDALGVPYEFKKRGTFKCTGMTGNGSHNQPKGTWSDDTSLSLCLAEQIGEGFDLQELADKFYLWRYTGYMTAHDEVFDIGNATSRAIANIKKGMKPTECGGKGEYDNGNGSLMRIAPMVFYSTKYEDVKAVSSITHAHKISVDACYILVKYLEALKEGKDKNDAYKELLALDVSPKVKAILDEDLAKKDVSEIKSDGFVLSTLQASLWCFLTTNDFDEAVLKAVNLGDDTDTTGAVTGAIAGLYYGRPLLPEEWVADLAKSDMIESIAENMIK